MRALLIILTLLLLGLTYYYVDAVLVNYQYEDENLTLKKTCDSLRHQVTIYDTLYHTTFRSLVKKEGK